MKHGSLFSGIGGFDLAAQWMGWENVFHCEWNEFGQKILKYYWPNAISYNDITKTDFSIHRGAIDILTGGFPCQPYSMAGKRKGKDDERHLWPEMLRAIREIQPRWVVGENVFGLINWNGGMVFDEVQADLEAAGYEVWPYVLPACAVNAPHRRDRVWFVAHRNLSRCRQGYETLERKSSEQLDCTHIQQNAPDSKGGGLERHWQFGESGGIEGNIRTVCANEGNITHNANNANRVRWDEKRVQTKSITDREGKWKYGATNSPQNNWINWPSQPPICNGDDGISSRLDAITFPKWRSESIKGGGNAIVPNVALQIFKAIDQYEIQNSFDNAA